MQTERASGASTDRSCLLLSPTALGGAAGAQSRGARRGARGSSAGVRRRLTSPDCTKYMQSPSSPCTMMFSPSSNSLALSRAAIFSCSSSASERSRGTFFMRSANSCSFWESPLSSTLPPAAAAAFSGGTASATPSALSMASSSSSGETSAICATCAVVRGWGSGRRSGSGAAAPGCSGLDQRHSVSCAPSDARLDRARSRPGLPNILLDLSFPVQLHMALGTPRRAPPASWTACSAWREVSACAPRPDRPVPLFVRLPATPLAQPLALRLALLSRCL